MNERIGSAVGSLFFSKTEVENLTSDIKSPMSWVCMRVGAYGNIKPRFCAWMPMETSNHSFVCGSIFDSVQYENTIEM